MVLEYIFKKTIGLTMLNTWLGVTDMLLVSLEWPDVTLDRIILEPNT